MANKIISISSDFFFNSLWAQKRALSEAEAWLDLVLNACQQDDCVTIRRHRSIQRRRGQVVTSLRELADRWHWTSKKIRCFLKHLVDEKMVIIESSSTSRIITIANYDSYVDKGKQKGTDNALNDSDICDSGANKRANNDIDEGKQKGKDNALNDSDICDSGANKRANDDINEGKQKGKDNALNDSDIYDSGANKRANDALRNSTRVNTSVFISTEDKSSVDDLQETPGANEAFVVDITSDSRRRMTKAEAKAVVDYYNEKADGCSLPKVKMLTIKRQASINARCCEHGRRTLLTAIDKAVASQFLNGDNRNGWTATFDWIFRPNNFVKIIEGNYDNRQKISTYKSFRRNRDDEKAARDEEFARHIAAQLAADGHF